MLQCAGQGNIRNGRFHKQNVVCSGILLVVIGSLEHVLPILSIGDLLLDEGHNYRLIHVDPEDLAHDPDLLSCK